MPLWRCPHCGTPQAETARCWVCRRSSTTCSTCRHFRRSVAAQLGYCGLDRRRLPMTGQELRGCWAAGPARSADATPAAVDPGEPSSPALRLRDFVPVELPRGDARVPGAREALLAAQPAIPEADEPRPDNTRPWADPVTLFVDAEL